MCQKRRPPPRLGWYRRPIAFISDPFRAGLVVRMPRYPRKKQGAFVGFRRGCFHAILWYVLCCRVSQQSGRPCAKPCKTRPREKLGSSNPPARRADGGSISRRTSPICQVQEMKQFDARVAFSPKRRNLRNYMFSLVSLARDSVHALFAAA